MLKQLNYLRILDFRGFSHSISEEVWTRFSSFVLQVDPLAQSFVELGVVVACPGEVRLVVVVVSVWDAIDAGDFNAHELQRG